MVITSTATPLDEDEKDYDDAHLPPEYYDEVPEGMEEVDGELIEKTGITLSHAAAQGNLIYAWRQHLVTTGQGGKVYPEAPCRTDQQRRRPDVAYLTAELLEQYGQPNIFPHSYPLIGEVASPDDSAEMLFSKVWEYLRSGCQEVWLLFPENRLVMIVTSEQWLVLNESETASTQTILPGFRIPVTDLFA